MSVSSGDAPGASVSVVLSVLRAISCGWVGAAAGEAAGDEWNVEKRISSI